MLSELSKLDIKLAFGLGVTCVDMQAVPWHRVTVARVLWVPASRACRRIRPSVSVVSTLSSSRGAPGTVSPSGVEVAGIASVRQSPMVGHNTKASFLSTRFYLSAVLLHGCSTLHTTTLTAGTV